MHFWTVVKIIVHVHHEVIKPPNKGQIPQELDRQVCPMVNIVNTHKKWRLGILDMFCDSCFPTLKHIQPILSKTKEFLNQFFLH
jgi:hypothetical protein